MLVANVTKLTMTRRTGWLARDARIGYPAFAIGGSNVRFMGTAKNEEQHGGQIVANVLKAHGVEHIFTLVSGRGF